MGLLALNIRRRQPLSRVNMHFGLIRADAEQTIQKQAEV